MIARLRHRLATRRAEQSARAQSELIDQILIDQRHHVSRPSRTIYDETCVALKFDPLAGVKVQRISRVIAAVHGAALAAPLRGAR